jgi:hypothetical protein
VVECASLENWYTCKGIESSNLSPSAILPPYVAIVLTNILTNSVRKHNDYNRLIVFGWTRRMRNPFRNFNSSPEVIRLTVMMYIRYPLSLRQVEDLLFERGIDICHETVRLWWNRFGPMFAAEIRKRRVQRQKNRSAALAEWRQLAA